MQLLVLNPNTSHSTTRLLQDHIGPQLDAGVNLHMATARFGAAYVADEISYAVAEHAALDAYAEHCRCHGQPDAVLLACFGDPGVWALRALSGKPVIGLAEAAMREACAHGRFAIVTGGTAWRPMLLRLVRSLGMADALTDVHVAAPTGAQLAADPPLARLLLGEMCRDAARDAHAVVLGGAGLAGMAGRIALPDGVPIVDSVDAGWRAAVRLARSPASDEPPSRSDAAWTGLSEALAAFVCG